MMRNHFQSSNKMSLNKLLLQVMALVSTLVVSVTKDSVVVPVTVPQTIQRVFGLGMKTLEFCVQELETVCVEFVSARTTLSISDSTVKTVL